jgi:hypothetical protein
MDCANSALTAAGSRGRCLFHPQFQVFQQIFGRGDTGISHAEALFPVLHTARRRYAFP